MYLMKGNFCNIGIKLAGNDMRTAGIDLYCLLIVPRLLTLFMALAVGGNWNCTMQSTIVNEVEGGRSGAEVGFPPAQTETLATLAISNATNSFFIRTLSSP